MKGYYSTGVSRRMSAVRPVKFPLKGLLFYRGVKAQNLNLLPQQPFEGLLFYRGVKENFNPWVFESPLEGHGFYRDVKAERSNAEQIDIILKVVYYNSIIIYLQKTMILMLTM